MNISLELYKVFYTVAKHKSFSKAAKNLYISQSAVSQAIKNLEQNIGVPLFIRSTKNVSLTVDGDILFEHLSQVFNLIQRAEEKLQMRQDRYNGQVIIASTDTLCKYFLLPKIYEITKNHPNIKIKIINGTSLKCMQLLKDSMVDFALVNFTDTLDLRLRIEKQYSFNDVFISNLDFDNKNKLSLEDIAKLPLMTLDNKSVTRNFMDSLFLKKGISINPEVELQNIDLLIDMTELGLGISFVPDLYIKDRNVKIIKTKEKIPKRNYGVISLEKIELTPVAKTFLEFL